MGNLEELIQLLTLERIKTDNTFCMDKTIRPLGRVFGGTGIGTVFTCETYQTVIPTKNGPIPCTGIYFGRRFEHTHYLGSRIV